MKDNFSSHSHSYSRFRPTYPRELAAWLASLVRRRERVWDCGTGNGQLARLLADFFGEVAATDLSANQIANAMPAGNIVYRVESAERSSFPDRVFDLVTVAQAAHWFDFDRFYGEVNRTLKPDGVIALLGYGLPHVNDEVDRCVRWFHGDVISPYWDKERILVDTNFETIPFPFDELDVPHFESRHAWNLEQFIGYLGTWSAVKHYREARSSDPLDLVRDPLVRVWGHGEAMRDVGFPIFARVGRKPATAESPNTHERREPQIQSQGR